MSISIGHRALFTAFRYCTSLAPRAAAPAPFVEIPPATAALAAGELKCSPWVGLYLEQAQPVTPEEADAYTSRQLDAFLASLMYGE